MRHLQIKLGSTWKTIGEYGTKQAVTDRLHDLQRREATEIGNKQARVYRTLTVVGPEGSVVAATYHPTIAQIAARLYKPKPEPKVIELKRTTAVYANANEF